MAAAAHIFIGKVYRLPESNAPIGQSDECYMNFKGKIIFICAMRRTGSKATVFMFHFSTDNIDAYVRSNRIIFHGIYTPLNISIHILHERKT